MRIKPLRCWRNSLLAELHAFASQLSLGCFKDVKTTKQDIIKRIFVAQIFSDSSRLYPLEPFSQTQHNVLLSPLKACIVTAVITASKINTTSLSTHLETRKTTAYTQTHTLLTPIKLQIKCQRLL